MTLTDVCSLIFASYRKVICVVVACKKCITRTDIKYFPLSIAIGILTCDEHASMLACIDL